MRIRVNTMIRGAGITANAGDECDAPAATAVALIANGLAVAVMPEPAIEAAVIESPESTTQPRPTPRRGRRAEE